MSIQQKTQNTERDQEKKLEFLLQNLQELQFRINRGPQHFVPEMRRLIDEFKELFQKVQENPSQKNDRFIELCLFLQGVSHHYTNSFQFFPKYLTDLLDNYAEQLNPKILIKMVICLIGIRNRDLIQPMDSLTCMFKLFRIQNKELRKIVFSHIVNDIKRMNKKHQNIQFNKKVQNMIADIIKNNTDNLAKRSLQIAIQLFKSQVWNDPKTVNMISNGCFNSYYKLILISCFFLIQTTEIQDVDSDSEEEDFKALNETKGSKRTRSKEARLEKEKKKHEKKLRKRAAKQFNKSFFPIDQIYNPQDFCEKLFAQLKKFTGKFEVKLAMISVISRMVGRHNLILINFYSFLLKYLNPNQRDIGKLLAYLAESIHEQLPNDDLDPIIKHLIDQFIGEHCTDNTIVMGLNTVREIVFKKFQLLDYDKLNYICEFSDYKEKNVNQAAKSIINYYRDVNPKLLHKKYRGKIELNKKIDEEIVKESVSSGIKGAELLNQDGDYPVYMERVLDDYDFKRIKYLQKKKFEKEEEERQNELQRLREVRQNNVNEDESECSEISEYDEDIEEDFEDDDENNDDDIEDDISDDEIDKNSKVKNQAKKIQNKNSLQKRKYQEEEMSSLSESEDQNPHNFISEGKITNFKKTKAQQKKETLEKKATEGKEKAYNGPKQKGGGTTNKQKLKNKNLIMLRPKKNREKLKNKQVNATLNRIKCIKNQLGHVQSGKEAARKKKIKLK